MSDTRTITLTGRPPVTIIEADWPILADAQDSDHDNQHECQANRRWKWLIRVRQHFDGRALVFATYSYSTQYQGERDVSARHGDMLPVGATADDICRAIASVASRMPGDRWDTLAAECVADMPAEVL